MSELTNSSPPIDPVYTELETRAEVDNRVKTRIIPTIDDRARSKLNDIEINTPGSRHVLQLIEHHALTTPDRTYASIPKDPDNISFGFHDISYAVFLNAINHAAHYLARTLPVSEETYEVVAYAGPKDIRYAIIACALAKLEKRFLFISSGATLAGQTLLVRQTRCKVFLYGGSFLPHVQTVVQDIPHVFVGRLPEVQDFITEDVADSWDWNKTWEEVRYTTWMILHSSGTTGHPKPIEFTHQMMCNFDAAALMPDAEEDSICKHIPGRRWYSPLLTMHQVGMYVALQFTVFMGGVAVFGPPGDTSATLVRDTLRYGNCQAIVSPPFYIEAMASEPLGLKTLRGLDYIYFAGAPMSRVTAEKLVPYVPVMPGMGTTESGMYFIKPRDEQDWEYYTFRESNGIEFDHLDEDMYELVLRRKPELARWQQIFQLHPEMEESRTGDIWVQHQTKPGAWKMIGRTDDLVVFSHGKKLNAAAVEMELGQCPGIAGVIVGGRQRARPFVLVEWEGEGGDDETRLDQLWAAMKRINEGLSEFVRMQRELILPTGPGKKLVRNAKGGPARRASEALFAEETARMYSSSAFCV